MRPKHMYERDASLMVPLLTWSLVPILPEGFASFAIDFVVPDSRTGKTRLTTIEEWN